MTSKERTECLQKLKTLIDEGSTVQVEYAVGRGILIARVGHTYGTTQIEIPRISCSEFIAIKEYIYNSRTKNRLA